MRAVGVVVTGLRREILMSSEQIKDLDNLRPIDHAVIAKPHTPVYKMHRYFARRPWSVFHELIKHYSNPGSVVLDPFCGGGVTVVEGLRLGRKVIGVDVNPLATFVTRMEVTDVDLKELEAAFEAIEGTCRRSIEELYLTTCPRCGKTVPGDWFEWSNVVQCKDCGNPVELHLAQRVGGDKKSVGVSAGKFKCYHKKCRGAWRPSECKRLDDVLIAVCVLCPQCNKKSEFEPRDNDSQFTTRVATNAHRLIRSRRFWYPELEMPDWWDLRRPYNAHIKRFDQLFTARNLLANAILATCVKSWNGNDSIKSLLTLTFSASLRFSNRMVFRNKGWQGGNPIEWASSVYWLPEVFCEINVWRAWRNRVQAVLRGKRDSADGIGRKCRFTNRFDEIPASATALIHTGGSARVPLPDGSVDAIITDPPYGNNVLYAELCNFYWAWVGGILGENGLIDDREEAVVSKEHDKSIVEYRELLYNVFRECHRVLKRGRWMVMTFHNKEFKVWNAIHLAAHDAGFVLAEQDGMIYQPPIANYTQTIQTRRAGSMLGDFILSFQKVDRPPAFKAINHAEMGRHIERLAGEAVIYHNGATLSTIYMKLIPWLLNNNLLERIGEEEVVPFLARNFEEREGRWHLRGEPDQVLRQDLERYSQQHYKTSYADAMQTVPVEARLEYLIRRLLYRQGQATQDEILNEIYTNLINSNAADYGEIQRVLARIAELRDSTEGMAPTARKGLKKRKVWRLHEDVAREQLFEHAGVTAGQLQTSTKDESDHDLAIYRLVELAGVRRLRAHIGKAEQSKYTEFRKLTSDLPARVAGMPQAAREIVEQIDVLWHNGGRGIVAAFEVERTTTITSGIDRFRNLLAAAPDADIELYIIVPSSRADEVRAKIGSPANRRDGLHRRIAYIHLEDLQITGGDPAAIQWEQIIHRVNGGK